MFLHLFHSTCTSSAPLNPGDALGSRCSLIQAELAPEPGMAVVPLDSETVYMEPVSGAGAGRGARKNLHGKEQLQGVEAADGITAT